LGPPEYEAGVLTSIPWYFNGRVRKNKQAVEWIPELHFWVGLFNDALNI
jgi:hypothetical protein